MSRCFSALQFSIYFLSILSALEGGRLRYHASASITGCNRNTTGKSSGRRGGLFPGLLVKLHSLVSLGRYNQAGVVCFIDKEETG